MCDFICCLVGVINVDDDYSVQSGPHQFVIMLVAVVVLEFEVVMAVNVLYDGTTLFGRFG